MRRATALVSMTALLGACVIHRLEVTPVGTDAAEPKAIVSPVKVHLVDGSTVVFPNGVSVEQGVVRGDGRRYGLTLGEATSVSEVPTEQVAAIESYQTPVSTGASVGASVGLIIGGAALGAALFGSCPTVYALDGAGGILEAELFSYSIAPSFQGRDVDRLGFDPATHGSIELEVRNEMLETHYIDELELLEIVHAPEETVYPNESGEPLVVAGLAAPLSAVDQSGRDVRETVGAADGVAWSTPDERLASVDADDLLDYLDLEFDVSSLPRKQRNVALVLRMRNSLLNTVLLYDVMLKGQGYGALDWMGTDLDRLRPWLNLGLWYRGNMGMNVAVWRNGRFQKVKHLGDLGPIAWGERAIEVPAGDDPTLKVRLSFVADNWRIDRVALAATSNTAEVRAIAVERATTPEGERRDIPAFLAKSDREYLITQPGDSVRLAFDVGDAPQGKARTWLLASEGYYMEWMRADWLSDGRLGPFEPGTAALTDALALYADKRANLRAQFESTKIPVR